jgi:hypothetical protein
VIRLDGIAIAMVLSAVRTRSRASDTALSGRPTIEVRGQISKPLNSNSGLPLLMVQVTSTSLAIMPNTDTP